MAYLSERSGKSQYARIDEALATFQKKIDRLVKDTWGPKFHASVAWWWDTLGTANMDIRVVSRNAVYAEKVLQLNGIGDTLSKGDEELVAYETAMETNPKEASEIEVDYWIREIGHLSEETFDPGSVNDLYAEISSPRSEPIERIDPRPSESLVPPKFSQYNEYRQGPYYGGR